MGILDAPVRLPNNRPSVSIGKRGTIYKQGVTTGITTTGKTSRHLMPVPSGCTRASDLFARWGDWQWGGNGTAPVGDLYIEAAIEHPGTGRPFRLFFKGQKTGLLTPLAHIDCDDLGIDIAGVANVYVRTWVRAVTSTVEVPCDWATTTSGLCWEQDGDHVMDLTAAPTAPGANPGPYLPQRFVFTPVALLARKVVPATADVVALVGDSNSATSDGSGCMEQATANMMTIRLAVAGASIIGWSQPGADASTVSANPQQLLESISLSGATVAEIALGTNDGGAGISSATAASLLNALCGQIKARLSGRKRVIVRTIPPQTTSTTALTDPSAQVPSVAQAFIAGLNDLIRAGLSNADWVLDAASYVEVDSGGSHVLNGTRWTLGTTIDGTHYSAAGQNAIAAAASTALAAVVAGQTGGTTQLSTAPVAPSNTAAPAITGTAQHGQTLSGSLGTWLGSPVPTKVREWQRDSVAIIGETAATYLVRVGDVGHVIREKVTATNASGTASAFSNTVTPIAQAAPGAPTGLVGTPGDSLVDLAWSAPASDGGSPITDYTVEYRVTSVGGAWTAFSHVASATTARTVTGLTNNTGYDFRVSAVNAVGTGTPSSTATATPVPLDTYAQVILARASNVSLWKLAETSGTTALDSGAGGNPGAYTGGVLLNQSGKNGLGAAQFDGTTGYMLTASNANLNLSAPFTWEAWIYPTSVAATVKVMIATAGAAHHRFMLAANGGGLMQAWCSGTFLSSSSVTLNAWNHIAITCSGTTVTFYLNGAAVGSGTGTYTPNSQLYIGQIGDGTGFFVGKMQYVAVYNAALSAGEVAANFAAMP